MLENLVASEYVKDTDNLMCWPVPENNRSMGSQAFKSLKEKQLGFFRKNGFRRIGRTAFFGFSPDPAHPSRFLSAASDANEKGVEFNTAADDGLSPREIAIKYPLHSAVINMKGQQAKDTINRIYSLDPSSIHAADASGMTPIHLAFLRVNPDAIAVLLALGGASELLNTHNENGMTPLEYPARDMQSSREFQEAVIGLWGGYTADQLICEFLGRRALNLPTSTYDMKGYIAKRKFGCTCGTCAGGWLSKKMRLQLRVQAEICANLLKKYTSHDGSVHLGDLLLNGCISSSFCPSPLDSRYHEQFKGYHSVFVTISLFLRETVAPLSKGIIVSLTAGKDGVDIFFEKGGKVEHALEVIIDNALQQSSLIDDKFEDMARDTPDATKLLTCDNDLEFELVRRMVGLQ
ncbi:hypothetical protein DXG01_005787 [Tephrocybe rancida]|nr:hypothetical protein DXG01_005787 [Tephrocybe rancida]